MEHIFTDLKTTYKWAWLCLVLFVVSTVFLLSRASLTDDERAILAIISYIALLLFFLPSLIKAAHGNHEHVLTVLIWSLALVVIGIFVAIYVFYAYVGDNYAKYDKILNLLPVVLAIWAAAVGWLIHFKMTAKAHRTNNSFAIIMESRKNSEFLKRLQLIAEHFPTGIKNIPEEYHEFFSPIACAKALALEEGHEDRKKAEAIRALKFILNYYEFMALGIKVKDLDEKLLFETMHPSVTKVFERSRALIEYSTNEDNEGGDATFWCELRELVCKWNAEIKKLPQKK